MVLHSTAPGRFSNQCGKSVPPPAKLMRTGVFARMMTAFGSLASAKASGRNVEVEDISRIQLQGYRPGPGGPVFLLRLAVRPDGFPVAAIARTRTSYMGFR